MAAPTVAVVGGGLLGAALTLRLAQAGAQVTLLERASTLGGLAGDLEFDGHVVDRFYHVVTPADERMIAAIDEVGLSAELHFSPVGVGFRVDGRTYPFNGIGDFARFSALSPLGRARLAAWVVRCQLQSRAGRLEDTSLLAWLRRTCGAEVTERIWRPLLDSRFDGRHDELPATYLWARTRRMSSARTGADRRETMGALRGGHASLVRALVQRAQTHGATLELGAVVEGLTGDRAHVRGLRVGGQDRDFDLVVATQQPPALAHLLGPDRASLLAPYPKRFLGVVCAILKTRRELLPFYSINLAEPTPITTVVEASQVVGTAHTDGLRLVYLPKYCEADAPEFTEADEQFVARAYDKLRELDPSFDPGRDVAAWTVQRAKVVEPVHARGVHPRVAPFVPPGTRGLALVSAAQIYPRLLNGESILGLAADAHPQLTQTLGLG